MIFPSVDSTVQRTANGTPYLKAPGVVVISQPSVNLSGMRPFLEGFGQGFEKYLDDPVELQPAEQLTKVAGQLCYLSLGDKRTMNAEAQRYFDHIKESGHGSVLEHPTISMLLYGIDRGVTHEVVRHRAGWGFSQVSQRYVDGRGLRFVERPEWQADFNLHQKFERRIDRAAAEYEELAEDLLGLQGEGSCMILFGDAKTERRKKVNQAARSCLPNETEAPIVVSGNLRAIRHKVEMRANKAADTPIRELAVRILECVRPLAPLIMSDHEIVTLPDGTRAVDSKYRKV